MISQNIFQKAILFIAILMLVGCGSGPELPQIGDIKANPDTTIATGDQASLTISVSGSDLEFEWSAAEGSLSDSTTPNVIYTAPRSPGLDIVTVKVKYRGGETFKDITFNVVEPPTPTAANTSVPADTPTPTAMPKSIACNLAPVTKNLFPQLADENGQFPIYGPVEETRLLCQAVYDRVHDDGLMAVHIKFVSYQENFAWWGIATPNGYNASSYSQICLWAYEEEPNQSFRFKMKDTAGREDGLIVTLEKTNEWEEVCVDVNKFVELGINVTSIENINLAFETPTGSADVWIADLEFR